MKATSACPCQSGKSYSNCCAPCHQGQQLPATAEALMRSRYSAYALADDAYLLSSWHPSTRPAHIESEPPAPKWFALTIKRTEAGQAGDQRGTVEYLAKCRVNGRAHRLHEISEFIFEDGRWYYLKGDVLS